MHTKTLAPLDEFPKIFLANERNSSTGAEMKNSAFSNPAYVATANFCEVEPAVNLFLLFLQSNELSRITSSA